jgi:hypothetical protein
VWEVAGDVDHVAVVAAPPEPGAAEERFVAVAAGRDIRLLAAGDGRTLGRVRLERRAAALRPYPGTGSRAPSDLPLLIAATRRGVTALRAGAR